MIRSGFGTAKYLGSEYLLISLRTLHSLKRVSNSSDSLHVGTSISKSPLSINALISLSWLMEADIPLSIVLSTKPVAMEDSTSSTTAGIKRAVSMLLYRFSKLKEKA